MKKTALITGASTGIGMELAKVFAKNKHDLVLVARSKDKLDDLSNMLKSIYGVQTKIIIKDLTKENSVLEIYNELRSEGINIEFLVNNAGFGDYGLFNETDWLTDKQMIDLNITALTQLCKLFVEDMISKKKGKIMNVASTAAFQPGPLMAVYYATKSYVLHFSEAINNELKDKGITVTALCPGPTESGFQEKANISNTRLVKVRKLQTSQDVAEYGYNAMMKGKAVAIHGITNFILAQSNRISPRSLAVKLVRKIQS